VRVINVVQHSKAYIEKSELVRILTELFRDKLEIPEEAFLENGNLCKWETYYTSHSWDEKEILRKATEEDIQAVNVLDRLKKSLKEEKE